MTILADEMMDHVVSHDLVRFHFTNHMLMALVVAA